MKPTGTCSLPHLPECSAFRFTWTRHRTSALAFWEKTVTTFQTEKCHNLSRLLSKNGHHPKKRLLRDSGREEIRFGGRYPQSISQACSQVPSRRKSGRQSCGREIQGIVRSQ